MTMITPSLHAGRGVVNKSDLMLYLRKQPDLQERVTQE